MNWLGVSLGLVLILVSDLGLPTNAKKRQHHGEQGEKNSRMVTLNATAVTGIAVDLRCKVKLHECGNFFSIEWYREVHGRPSERVYVYRYVVPTYVRKKDIRA